MTFDTGIVYYLAWVLIKSWKQVHCHSFKLESYPYSMISTNIIPTVIIKKFFHSCHYDKVCSLLLEICCFHDKKNPMHPVKNGRMFSEELIILINFVFIELQKKRLENQAKWSIKRRGCSNESNVNIANHLIWIVKHSTNH